MCCIKIQGTLCQKAVLKHLVAFVVHDIIQDSLDHCPMPINVDQDHGIVPKSTLGSMPEFRSALVIDRWSPVLQSSAWGWIRALASVTSLPKEDVF